jgi:hypothetical protein
MPSTAWNDFLKFCKIAGIVLLLALFTAWGIQGYDNLDSAGLIPRTRTVNLYVTSD